MTTLVRFYVEELLDYFGKCPDCGYPAEAVLTVRSYSEGRVERDIVAECGLPCGWSGPVPYTAMTAVRAA